MPANRSWKATQLHLPLAEAGYREATQVSPWRARLGHGGGSSPLQIYTALVAIVPLLELLGDPRRAQGLPGWARREIRRLLRHLPDAATYAAIVQAGMDYRPPWDGPVQTGTKREPPVLPDL